MKHAQQSLKEAALLLLLLGVEDHLDCLGKSVASQYKLSLGDFVVGIDIFLGEGLIHCRA